MNPRLFIVFTVAIAVSKAQDLNKWCPTVESDISVCEKELLGSLARISDVFGNISAILSAEVLSSKTMSVICHKSARPTVEKFFDCIFGKVLACIPRDWSEVFPGFEQAIASLEYMCSNFHDIDDTCVTSPSKVAQLSNCENRSATELNTPVMSSSYTVKDFLTYFCSEHKKSAICYQTVYASCPGRTADVITKAYEFQKPIGCDACVNRQSQLIFLILLCVNTISMCTSF